ncbi:uncharacterized protein [Magallana gigas]|uniref:uncharacterized protein isoform X2 n=1 Tax=Magallana gigas TaxID=29159 RepID=UPI00333FE180
MNYSADIVFLGSEIRPCDKSCEEEKCIPCPIGTYQPFLSHSDDPIRKQCFKPDLNCDPRDTIPVENGTYSPSCARQRSCACNHGKCFHGDPCQCERNFEPCGIDEEMNYKGTCVQCMEGYMKPYRGCNQCERIVPTPPKYQGETEREEGQTLNISSYRCFIGFREIEGVCTGM